MEDKPRKPYLFLPGREKTGGRTRGSSVSGKMLRDTILGAAKDAGDRLHKIDLTDKKGIQGYLAFMALKEPAAFMSLFAKVLPKQSEMQDEAEDEVIVTEIRLIAGKGE